MKIFKKIDHFLAPTRELYEPLCHRKKKRRRRAKRRKGECFWNNSECAILIWMKSGMDILLDTRNTPAEEFFIHHKTQDGRWRPPLGKITKSVRHPIFSRSMFSWMRNAMKLSFSFYDHSKSR